QVIYLCIRHAIFDFASVTEPRGSYYIYLILYSWVFNSSKCSVIQQHFVARFVPFLFLSSPSFLSAQLQYHDSSANLSTSWINDPYPIATGDNVNPYNSHRSPELVWSANRDHPVGVNATLQLKQDGDLVLANSDGILVWSTNTRGKSVSGLNLTEQGNLVLFGTNNEIIWQSFDYPTDTLLLGQRLVAGQKLTANVSRSRFDSGLLSLSVNKNRLIAYVESNPPQIYHASELDDLPYVEFTNGSFNGWSIPPGSEYQFMKFGFDGRLKVFQFTGRFWTEVANLFETKLGDCAQPLVCGNYGVCSRGDCQCPDQGNFFKQTDTLRPYLGCSYITPISCKHSEAHILLELKNTTYFAFEASSLDMHEGKSVEDCKSMCLSNCSCKAALFVLDLGGKTLGKNGRCSLLSQVFSIINKERVTGSVSPYDTTLYLKVQKPRVLTTEKKKMTTIVASAVATSLGLISAIAFVLVLFSKRLKNSNKLKGGFLDQVRGMPTIFSYEALKAMTGDFSKKLGEGGFGSVYEGALNDGTKMAAKCLDGVSQVNESFLVEVETIGSIHHVNLVKLIGFCFQKSHRILIYEHMANGSLDRWIFNKDHGNSLPWHIRRKIIMDIAKGLAYLHEECSHKIIHFDIKPQNILLDENFNAKVSDFGLAKLIEKDQSGVLTRMRGTPGYLAPECAAITEKVDVYSFGIVMLEIICGRKNLDWSRIDGEKHLLAVFKGKAEEGKLKDLVDKRSEVMQENIEEAVEMMKIAAWCLQGDFTKRPSMSLVVKVLEGLVAAETNIEYDFLHPAVVTRILEAIQLNTHILGCSFLLLSFLLPSVSIEEIYIFGAGQAPLTTINLMTLTKVIVHGAIFNDNGGSISGGYTFNVVLRRRRIFCGFYFVIWHIESFRSPQVVWSANRNNPAQVNATYQLTQDGDLILSNSDGTPIWSIQTKGKSVAGMNLTESGNLVLFGQNNETIWQSFDYPTDSLLPGQSLISGQRLTACVSTSNWSEVLFYLSFDSEGQELVAGRTNLDSSSNPEEDTFYEHSKSILPTIVSKRGGSTPFEKKGNEHDFVKSKQSQIFIKGVASCFMTKGYPQLILDVHRILIFYHLKGGTEANLCDHDCICSLRTKRVGVTACAAGNNRVALYSSLEEAASPVEEILREFCPRNLESMASGCDRLDFCRESRVIEALCSRLNNKVSSSRTLPSNGIRIFILLKASRFIKKASTFVGKERNPSGSKIGDLQNLITINSIHEAGSRWALKVKQKILQEDCKNLCLTNCSCKAAAFAKSYGHPKNGGGILCNSQTPQGVKKQNKQQSNIEEDLFDQVPGMPTRYSYEDLKTITEDFGEKLGEGGSGSVYKGTLRDGTKVAVKCLDGLAKVKDSFLVEVKAIGSIQHVNLVKLIGFCFEKSHRLLVYEYMNNRSLEGWIFSGKGKNHCLPWKWHIRKNIITDIAKGLAYLHEECSPKIIHLDIKPENILLDENFNAKISDFGLSKLIEKDQSRVITTMRGTPGYLAPEWLSAAITEKADVYSFGIVMLEIICGRKNLDSSRIEGEKHLLAAFKRKAEEGKLKELVDERSEDMRENAEEAVEMMKIAAWCLQGDFTKRPSMSLVVKMLQLVTEIQIKKPFIFHDFQAKTVSSQKFYNSTAKLYNSTAKLSTSWINQPSMIANETSFVSHTFSPITKRVIGQSAFVCGFYCNNDGNLSDIRASSKDCIFGVIIIWSANRNYPVQVNATLQLSQDGDLILKNSDGTLVWSSQTAGKSVAGMNLTENGNLVLFGRNNEPIWQSFDYPTDSLLLGQKLLRGQRLTASVSASNASEGLLYLSVDSTELAAYINSNPPQKYYSSGFDQNPSYVEFTNGSFHYYTISSTAQFVKFGSDGHLKAFRWGNGPNGLEEVSDLLETGSGNCGYPMVCGKYGVCSDGGQCGCLDTTSSQGNFFRQVNFLQPNLGCSLVTPISCDHSNSHGLIELNNTYYFAFQSYKENTLVQDCKNFCLRNCSCKAALFVKSQYGNRHSRKGSCLLVDEVFSIANNENGIISSYNTTLYVKVQLPYAKASRRKVTVLASVISAIVGLFCVICSWFVLIRKQNKQQIEEDFLIHVPGMPTRYTYENLKAATEDFSKKLGEGGFGCVYEGALNDGTKIAAKCLDGLAKVKDSFLVEVKAIGSIHHVNLVKLIGYCFEKSHRLLVYEYMANRSLDGWIFCGKEESNCLPWQARRNIILDIAKGLAYLHEECSQTIIHLDIKPQNILLDQNFNAKISDFGLSKLIEKDQSRVITTMRGTPGYLAPEWLSSAITEKVDVYSFGIVLLEIICGRKNVDWSRIEEDRHLLAVFKGKAEEGKLKELVDERSEDMHHNIEEVLEMMKIAAWCLQGDFTKRPSMSLVVKVLEGLFGRDGYLKNMWPPLSILDCACKAAVSNEEYKGKPVGSLSNRMVVIDRPQSSTVSTDRQSSPDDNEILAKFRDKQKRKKNGQRPRKERTPTRPPSLGDKREEDLKDHRKGPNPHDEERLVEIEAELKRLRDDNDLNQRKKKYILEAYKHCCLLGLPDPSDQELHDIIDEKEARRMLTLLEKKKGCRESPQP
ncbi:OLC1v1023653C1, partial [Oldenlandia corymbosa var. corymbosa]